MKIWTRTFGAALTLALFSGCTVTVGSGNGDDSDDLDFSEKSEEPETTEEDTQTTDKPETTTDEEPTEAETSTPTNDAAAPPATSSSPAESTSSVPDETTSEPPPANVCEGEPEPGSCDACVKDSCEADWAACCAAEGCVETWMAIYGCVLSNPSEDPLSDFDNCAAGASETGDALDLPYEVLDLTSCVNSTYMGPADPNWDRQEGDGTCTLWCYNVPSLDQ